MHTYLRVCLCAGMSSRVEEDQYMHLGMHVLMLACGSARPGGRWQEYVSNHE